MIDDSNIVIVAIDDSSIVIIVIDDSNIVILNIKIKFLPFMHRLNADEQP